MLDKIKDGFNVFHYGQQVANPAIWKAGGNAIAVVAPLITYSVKLAGDFGYGIQMSNEEAAAIAGGIVAIVSFLLNNITSRKAGLLPAKQPSFPKLHSAEDVQGVGATDAATLQPVSEAGVEKPLTEQEARGKY